MLWRGGTRGVCSLESALVFGPGERGREEETGEVVDAAEEDGVEAGLSVRFDTSWWRRERTLLGHYARLAFGGCF